MHESFTKKTKIVATLGPASNSPEKMRELIIAGTNIFRINFSHGSHDQHHEAITNVLKVRSELNGATGILADLQGPKIRLGDNYDENGDDGIEVYKGDEIVFTTKIEEANPLEKVFEIRLDTFANDVQVGEKILVDDGKLELEVLSKKANGQVRLNVLNDGKIKSKKGVNLPDTKLSIPSLTVKDLEDLEFILENQFDWVALSFVRKAEDIIGLRKILDERDSHLKIIAKIEKPEALEDIDNILKVTDAVMVARGDLGVEIPFEKVPIVQRRLVEKCIEASKPVIIATQVMESMIANPKPTRAEITDVANAVMQGADAVMLR